MLFEAERLILVVDVEVNNDEGHKHDKLTDEGLAGEEGKVLSHGYSTIYIIGY